MRRNASPATSKAVKAMHSHIENWPSLSLLTINSTTWCRTAKCHDWLPKHSIEMPRNRQFPSSTISFWQDERRQHAAQMAKRYHQKAGGVGSPTMSHLCAPRRCRSRFFPCTILSSRVMVAASGSGAERSEEIVDERRDRLAKRL